MDIKKRVIAHNKYVDKMNKNKKFCKCGMTLKNGVCDNFYCTEKEFNLSEKEWVVEHTRVYKRMDVKEFIRLLKEKFNEKWKFYDIIIEEINQLAGDDLNGRI